MAQSGPAGPGNLVNGSKRVIGAEGMEVGPLSYGLWRFTTSDVDAAQGLIETALDSGMNLIDTADVYGFDWGGTGFGAVEDLLGEVLAKAPHLRDRMVLSAKGGIRPPAPYDSGSKALRTACEDSLRRMGVDVIDLYQIHRPDMFTHPGELAATLRELVDEGKVREIGVSNHSPAQISALRSHMPMAIASNQFEFSADVTAPLRDGTFDQAMQHGIVPLVWSPLAGGRLVTGEAIRPELVKTLDRLAERESVDRSIIALAFVLSHPSLPVCIIGTQTPERIVGSLAALDVVLDRNDCYDIIEASEGRPLP